MIKIKMVSPIPNMLGLSDNMHTLKADIAFQPGMTVGDIMESFAEKNEAFKKIWRQRVCAALEKCLFAVNGSAVHLTENKWDIKLEDNIELRIFMPYAGG